MTPTVLELPAAMQRQRQMLLIPKLTLYSLEQHEKQNTPEV